MIIFVDLEHRRLQEQQSLWEKSASLRLQAKYRLEAISGDHCLLVPSGVGQDFLHPANRAVFEPDFDPVSVIARFGQDHPHLPPAPLRHQRESPHWASDAKGHLVTLPTTCQPGA